MSGPGAAREGVVASFDEAVGLGSVETPAGEAYPFHCTQIADGTRRIRTGTPVVFVLLAGRGGRWEAGDLRPAPSGPAGACTATA